MLFPLYILNRQQKSKNISYSLHKNAYLAQKSSKQLIFHNFRALLGRFKRIFSVRKEKIAKYSDKQYKSPIQAQISYDKPSLPFMSNHSDKIVSQLLFLSFHRLNVLLSFNTVQIRTQKPTWQHNTSHISIFRFLSRIRTPFTLLLLQKRPLPFSSLPSVQSLQAFPLASQISPLLFSEPQLTFSTVSTSQTKGFSHSSTKVSTPQKATSLFSCSTHSKSPPSKPVAPPVAASVLHAVASSKEDACSTPNRLKQR